MMPLPVSAHTVLLALLLVVGLFFPTSIAGDQAMSLFYIQTALLVIVLVLFALRPGGLRGPRPIANVLAINILLAVFTVLSPAPEMAWGSHTYYLLFSLLAILNLSDLGLEPWLRRLFVAASFVCIAMAFGILFEIPAVTNLLVDRYNAYYRELVPLMLGQGKPVLTFASHSFAGFFYYLFFYLNFAVWQRERDGLHLVLALTFLALSLFLGSVTAYAYAALAAAQLALHFGVRSGARDRAVALLSVLVVGGVIAQDWGKLRETGTDAWELITSDRSGIKARYSAEGVLAPNIDYIVSHPLQPIGLGTSVELWHGDSGLVEHAMRGSLPLVLCIYVGFLGFLLANLRERRLGWFLFFVYCAFEVGMNNLFYLRTLYTLPFVVVFLNGIGSEAPAPAAAPGYGVLPRTRATFAP